MVRIAVDAMGGDEAPGVPVAGALEALEDLQQDTTIVLVGREKAIRRALEEFEVTTDRIEVVAARQVVEMDEKPLAALRAKPDSSISVGLELQKSGKVDAFLSAGNTGAVMIASTLMLGLHPGIERPAIGALFPTAGTPVLVLDAGANVDSTPGELLGFAKIGTVYAIDVLHHPRPRVGLLNIGEESEKGNQATREAFRLLSAEDGVNFVGNVEGFDILQGKSDVVVSDGFVGNVLLKFFESAGRFFADMFRREMGREILAMPGAKNLFRVLDYSEYGGAPLLGIKGVSIICHGRSPARAIARGIVIAEQSASSHVSQHIGDRFSGEELAS